MSYKMRALILLISLVLSTQATAIPCTRERVVNCVNDWVDSDSDGRISAVELDNFLTLRRCGFDTLQFTGADLVLKCSTAGVGYLQAEDYDAPNSCLRPAAMKQFICRKCAQCERTNAP